MGKQTAINELKSRSFLKESDKEDLAPFFAQSFNLMCIAGFDGYFKYLNPAWADLLGWTLKELKARPYLEFVHPDDRKATQMEVKRLSESGVTFFFENRYRLKDSSYRWMRWNAWSVPDNNRIYAIAWDVTRQKRLERDILKIADLEKERLGRELHDGLCQNLAGISALSTTLARCLTGHSDSSLSAAATEIATLLHETIQQTRKLAHGFGLNDLISSGLGDALEDLTLNVQHLFRVFCTFDSDHSILKLPSEVEGHLYRIAQEAVNNALTHGKSNTIEISLHSKDGEGILIIRDNGVGIQEEVKDVQGIGMHTMAYRAGQIGAHLKVRRRIKSGTAVTCTFPLNKPTENC